MKRHEIPGYSERQNRRSVERFWELVEKTEACWVWRGDRLPYGYGKFRPFRTQYRKVAPIIPAHRYSFALANGGIDATLHVLHKCDNPWCVNPDHLFQGTDADNALDKVAKGRSMRGERQHKAKLTDADIVAIRRSPADALTLSSRYGISRQNIYAIRSGKTWKHLL